jgi:LmbE family N-acetylglucosaminyl deacetylase
MDAMCLLHLRRRGRTVPALAALVLLAVACAEEPVCLSPASDGEVAAPPAPACENARLERYAGILVLAPHPDDEVLAFAGLVDAYLQQGKPVEVVVVTDGDAYCEACRFWKSGSVEGPTCTAEELSNLGTSAVDSFAEVRREESRRALALLDAGPPEFLGYPDIGIRIAWNRGWLGEASQPLQRSDFSRCESCETCAGGYARGPETELTAASLAASLEQRLAATPPRTLVATTHWLDRHGDHAALGNLVKRINDGLDDPRPIAYGVIHAHTAKDLPLPECWYPAPRAVQCDCAEEACAEAAPDWLAALRGHRYRPRWPASLPDDAAYGEPVQLCLREEMYAGREPRKLAAIETYASQIGSASRDGPAPAHLRGIVDCSGYLLAFARSTEAFVLHDPAGAEPACDPSGTWRGERVEATPEGRPTRSRAELELGRTRDGDVTGRLTWTDGEGHETAVDLRGALTEGCRLRLQTRSPRSPPMTATLSRDGRSLYASWQDPPGFLAVHR